MVFSSVFARILLVMALASPLGLALPEWVGAGAAWGEWSPEEVGAMVGYVPARMESTASLWSAWIPDYALPGTEAAPLSTRGLHYIFSALIGITLCAGVSMISLRLLLVSNRAR
jgi:hypothetical protein